MNPFKRAGFALLGLSLLLLATTISWAKNTQIEIPFTTSSGHNGSVVMTIPQKVFAGDKGKVTATINLTNVTGAQPTVGIEARLEAGFEELSQPGLVRTNLIPGTVGKFSWGFRTTRPADYPGNLWLWLIEDEKHDLILVHEFKLESVFYLGQRVLSFRIVFLLLILISVFMLLYHGLQPQKRKH